jgi:hypothetical protein
VGGGALHVEGSEAGLSAKHVLYDLLDRRVLFLFSLLPAIPEAQGCASLLCPIPIRFRQRTRMLVEDGQGLVVDRGTSFYSWPRCWCTAPYPSAILYPIAPSSPLTNQGLAGPTGLLNVMESVRTIPSARGSAVRAGSNLLHATILPGCADELRGSDYEGQRCPPCSPAR